MSMWELAISQQHINLNVILPFDSIM